MPGLVLIDGMLVPPEEARVSVFDRGFLYGDGIFETLRVYGGVPFALALHLERLAASAERIALSGSWGSLERDALRLVEQSGLAEAVLRITVTRGVGPGVVPDPTAQPTVVMSVAPLPPLPRAIYEEGLSARVVREVRPYSSAKTTSYLPSILASAAARREGADEAILIGAHGDVAEAASANIFAYVDGRWVTPPAGPDILNGVTRRTLLELCARHGVRAAEEKLPLVDLRRAHAIALTSSIREVVPIVRLDGAAVGHGRVPEETVALHALYRRAVQP